MIITAKTIKSIFQTYKVGKSFWDKLNKPTIYDLYKILILESYFRIIKEKVGIEFLEENITDLTFNSDFSYIKTRMYMLEDIVDDEYFQFIHNYTKDNYPEKFEEIEKNIIENIQLYVSELVYTYKENFKEITDYYDSPIYRNKRNKFKTSMYEAELSQKFQQDYPASRENFMIPKFNNGMYVLKDVLNALESEKHIFILGRDESGKTSIAYKILSEIKKHIFYLDYGRHIVGRFSSSELFEKIKDIIGKEIGIEGELDINNYYLIIDNIKTDESVQNILDLLKDEKIENIKLIIFLPLKLQEYLNDTCNIYTLDIYPKTLIEKLKNKEEINNHFVQVYCEDKTIEEQLKIYEEDNRLKIFLEEKYFDSFINYYIGDLTKDELDKKLDYKLYCLDKQVGFLVAYHLLELIRKNNIGKLKEIFSTKEVSKQFLDLLTIQEDLNNIKKIISRLLDELLDGTILKVICPEQLNILNLLYAYWSILNLKDTENKETIEIHYGDYFNFEDIRLTEEEKEKEIGRRENLILLIKIYKSLYPDKPLNYCYQSFSKLKNNNLLAYLDFSYSYIFECDFSGLNLSRINFANAKIDTSKITPDSSEKLYFENTTISDSTLSNINFTQEMINAIIFENKNSLNIQAKEYEVIDFSNVNIKNMNFTDSNLDDCIFSNQDLSNTDFTNTTLLETDFINVDLTHAVFTNADLSYTNFQDTELYSNDFFNPDKSEFETLRGVTSINSVKGLDEITKERWKKYFEEEKQHE